MGLAQISNGTKHSASALNKKHSTHSSAKWLLHESISKAERNDDDLNLTIKMI